MYPIRFFATLTALSILSVICQEVGGVTEETCSPLCQCKREDNSSKVEVALCQVNPQEQSLECSVEWPVLFLTVKMNQFESSLLIRCQRIKRLKITSDSFLTVLRADMFQFSNGLEILVINAPIQTLESGLLRHLSRLQQLDISETNIDSISRSLLEECPISGTLRLVQNKISFIEDYSFKNCIYLVNLDLSMNLIGKITIYTFDGAFNLEVIDLSKNKITIIDDLSFKSLRKLRMLTLSDNLLHSIKHETFRNLDGLTHLRLNANKISYIAVDAFKSLNSIQVINLKDNKISRLDLMVFVHLKQLKLSFPDVDCVQVRDGDSENVSVEVLKEFDKHLLCDGVKRRVDNKGKVLENQRLVQQYSTKAKDSDSSTQTSIRKDSFLVLLENHPYLIPMALGGLAVMLVSIIVISVVCHVKNKRINELRLQELQMPMHSTL